MAERRSGLGAELLAELVSVRESGSPWEVRRIENLVVQEYLDVAAWVARRFAHRGAPLEDLEQQARLGLVEALRRWDPARSPGFLGYAVPTMEGTVKRWFRDHLTVIRRPRTTQLADDLVRRSRQELLALRNRMPGPAEIAEHSGLPLAQVLECARSYGICNPAPIDHPAVTARAGAAPDRDLDRAEVRADLARAWATLSELERQVISLYYWDGLTQSAVARELLTSQMQVSRTLARAMRRLATALAG
ncbi:sigma-70 family RNA polymerase sigma factor [Nakamurella sp. YIM 132087]|uniref:Sigma-70 family RNA polymerase sigma factor n=1 Tax=Nakamurella alba TaxID=2665158 RepID=A0A7K1FRX5_9ACTN|nr:sigma-70 family RNA polymerase sigma factor [Nakamurella alba]MTD16896.1 sigma-70 family RNA polymerase sigma factor [Nakamurella alba]